MRRPCSLTLTVAPYRIIALQSRLTGGPWGRNDVRTSVNNFDRLDARDNRLLTIDHRLAKTIDPPATTQAILRSIKPFSGLLLRVDGGGVDTESLESTPWHWLHA